MALSNEIFHYFLGIACAWLVTVVLGYYCYSVVLDKAPRLTPKHKQKRSVMTTDGLKEPRKEKKQKELKKAEAKIEQKKEVQLVAEVVFEMVIEPVEKPEPVWSVDPELTVCSIEPEQLQLDEVTCQISDLAPDMECMLNPAKSFKEPESPEEVGCFQRDVTDSTFDWNVVDDSEKVNERKPMVFIGGVSASCSPLELVHELKDQGFNVPVLPRIRYGSSFGFCPDLVLSSEEELRRILSMGRVWVKDRWLDVRPYIPKDDKDGSSSKGSVSGCNMDIKVVDQDSRLNDSEVPELLSDTLSSSHHSAVSLSPEIIPQHAQQQFYTMNPSNAYSSNAFIPYMIPTIPHQQNFPVFTHQIPETYPQVIYSDCLAASPGCYSPPVQQSFEAPLDMSM